MYLWGCSVGFEVLLVEGWISLERRRRRPVTQASLSQVLDGQAPLLIIELTGRGGVEDFFLLLDNVGGSARGVTEWVWRR